jgi:hypothetical protein
VVVKTFSAIAALFAVTTPARAQTFTFERVLPAAGVTRLDVATERGRIRVSVGAGPDVVVAGRVSVQVGFDVPVDAAALAESTANRPPVAQSGDTVTLGLPSDDRTRRAVTIAYDVRVPAGMRVTTNSQSGETTVEGTHGDLSVTTGSGSIHLVNLGPSGATVDSGSGSVSIDGIAGDLRVTTSSSGITATRLGGALHVRTGSGRVTAAFVGRGDVDIETTSSEVRLDGVNGGLIVSTGSGRVTVSGHPARDWDVTTGSGQIDATVNQRASFSIDASSGSGSVRTEDLMVEGEMNKRRVSGAVSGGGPIVRLTSRSASITLRAGR